MSLKEYMLKENKNKVYEFYLKMNPKAEEYEKISRNDIYQNIISLYKEDPEIILRLCSMEEIGILQKLLDENIKKQENGYIYYLLFQNLMNNYLILLGNNEYYIPADLMGYEIRLDELAHTKLTCQQNHAHDRAYQKVPEVQKS